MLKKEKLFILSGFILIIILFFLMLTALYLKGFYALSADEAGHTLEAYYWYKGISGFYSIWLPFQKLLYGITFHISSNLFWTPRILSSVFGLLTLMSLIYLSNQLFQNKTVALFTGGLGAIFWGIVVFSVLPMTEIYFFFFVVTSIAFLVKWKRDKSSSSLWLALFFTVIGSTVRYEAWIFTFVIFLIVFIDVAKTNDNLSTKLIKLLPVIIFLILFPLIWLYLSFRVTGEFTGFINKVTARYKPGNAIIEIKNNVIYYFLYINCFTVNIAGLTTFIILKKKHEIRIYFIIFISTLILSGILTYITKAMPTHNPWRLAAVWSILLLPLTAYFCHYLYSYKRIYVKFFLVLFLIILVSLSVKRINRYTELSTMTKNDYSVGSYINQHLLSGNSDCNIFIQKNNWEYTNILITSQHPTAFVTENYFSNDSPPASLPYYESFKGKLKSANVKYVILKPYNEDFFDLNKLILLKKFNNWIIYRLE